MDDELKDIRIIMENLHGNAYEVKKMNGCKCVRKSTQLKGFKQKNARQPLKEPMNNDRKDRFSSDDKKNERYDMCNDEIVKGD